MDISNFNEDLFDLTKFAIRLKSFIETEHKFVSGSLVLSLSSRFGTGKSTFLKMWSCWLSEQAGNDENLLVVSLNAWEDDYNGDPLFSIINALAEAIIEKGNSAENLISAAKNLGWFATAIGSQVARKFTGIDAIEAGSFAEKKSGKREHEKFFADVDSFTAYQRRKSSMDCLKTAIKEIIQSSTPRVLFIIDELDRCRPDYAISYLETIKHLFDIQGAVFIISIDRKHLENSAKTAFGPELDFNEYYRKFVHREIGLPPITENGYKNISKKYVEHYLERDESRICMMEIDDNSIDMTSGIIAALEMTPRQIQEAFRTFGHVFETKDKDSKGRLYWCLGIGSVAMSAFKIKRPDIYHDLGGRNLDPKKAADFLRELFTSDHEIKWWFAFFFTGYGLQTNSDENFDDILERAGMKRSENGNSELSSWSSGWGHGGLPNGFGRIYRKLEELSRWEQG